ncbi:MAG TPA: hypothetical protein VMO17_23905 [Terriglobia bacterium]|nr:hypothetical protein [Terriglobia bacterium]
MAFEWLSSLQHRVEKAPDYATKALAAYRLGVKAKGSIVGVVIEPEADCCDAARRQPIDKVYHPDEAPLLPLAECPKGRRCGCVYRPVMSYEKKLGT